VNQFPELPNLLFVDRKADPFRFFIFPGSRAVGQTFFPLQIDLFSQLRRISAGVFVFPLLVTF